MRARAICKCKHAPQIASERAEREMRGHGCTSERQSCGARKWHDCAHGRSAHGHWVDDLHPVPCLYRSSRPYGVRRQTLAGLMLCYPVARAGRGTKGRARHFGGSDWARSLSKVLGVYHK